MDRMVPRWPSFKVHLRGPSPLHFHWKPLWTPPSIVPPVDVLLVSLGGDLKEMHALIESAGHRVVGVVEQRRSAPDRRTFVGRGKLNELKDVIHTTGAGAVVINGELRPSQYRVILGELGVEPLDRLRILLDIFAERAHSKEAKLQVELAMFQYERPILREWIHARVVGERPGFMAGGEYRVEAYYETVKRKIKRIRDELERAGRERDVRRVHRQDRGFHLVGIAGYANAGKSSLLNALTDERVVVDDRMFSTLSTTTRAMARTRRRVLLTDTVGFVDDIPFWLVEAFQATFEEIFRSDRILLLVDASDRHGEIVRKVRLAARTLLPRASASSITPVLAKVDLVPGPELEDKSRLLERSEFHRTPLRLSSRTGEGVEELRSWIFDSFAYPVEMSLELTGPETPSTLSTLYDESEVLEVDYGPSAVRVRFRCRAKDAARFGRLGTPVERTAD